MKYIACCFFFFVPLFGAVVNEKVLICGVGKNVERAVPNTIQSTEELGSQFLDYRVIIYENNSSDRTKRSLRDWANRNNRVLFYSGNIREEGRREERIARARNKVLDVVMQDGFSDYKYVVMADLDIMHRWDVENVIDSILHPECEWDAIFANGHYDVYALRSKEVPIGFELAGGRYWWHFYNDDVLRNKLYRIHYFDRSGPWIPVYSAFGGLAIYKREAIQGCRYSGVVTKDLEVEAEQWLALAYQSNDIPLLEDYNTLLRERPIFDIHKEFVIPRNRFPDDMGVRLFNSHGLGKVVWFSCEKDSSLPITCEHIPFHASMAVRGHGKLFINPRLICEHP